MTREIILYIHTTLNGIVTGDPAVDKEDFGRQWAKEGNLVGKASAALLPLFDRADTILMGHGTHVALSKRWSNVESSKDAQEVAPRLAYQINHAHKLVASRTPSQVDRAWGSYAPAELVDGNRLADQVSGLKRDQGGDIIIFGSPTLSQELINAGLVDEFYFVVHPVIMPVGDHLDSRIETRTDLRLESVTSLEEGGLLIAYTRAVEV